MVRSIGPALAEAVRIAFDDASADWFTPVGPSIEALDAPAAARPAPGGNAPCQVLDHLRIGFLVWGEYLESGRFDPSRFGGGREWLPVGDLSESAWAGLRSATRRSEAHFRDVITGLPDEALLRTDPTLGDTTKLALILSTIAHLGYHAGELASAVSATAADRQLTKA